MSRSTSSASLPIPQRDRHADGIPYSLAILGFACSHYSLFKIDGLVLDVHTRCASRPCSSPDVPLSRPTSFLPTPSSHCWLCVARQRSRPLCTWTPTKCSLSHPARVGDASR